MKEQRNTWTEVDGVKLSMYTGEKLSELIGDINENMGLVL
jgi:hypothetical protein